MEYRSTMKGALEAANDGRIEAWIHEYLRGDGNNLAFSDGLQLDRRQYLGPIPFALRLLRRCTGPEEGMKYWGPADQFERRVVNIQKAVASGFDLPPLIVNYSQGELELNDGNHRFEALVRSGLHSFGVIIWTTGEADMEEFRAKYGEMRV